MKWVLRYPLVRLRDHLHQALQALHDYRVRAVLSILGIAVGIAAVMAISVVSKGGHHLIFRELETFGLTSVWVFRDREDKDPHRAVRTGTGIDNEDLAALQAACPSVQRATPWVFDQRIKGLAQAGSRYSHAAILGVGAEYNAINNDVLVLGRGLRTEDALRRRKVAVIGPEVQEDLFGPGRNPVGQTVRIGGDSFLVIGVLKPKSRDFLASIGSVGGENANNRILIPYTVRQQQLGKVEINVFQAQASSMERAQEAVTQILMVLKRRHGNQFTYNAETMAQYIQTANRILQGVSWIGAVAASVSLVVGGMGIMNIMTTSVLERTREIGIRKALGARKKDILLQFLVEAIAISMAGGVIGLSMGLLASGGLAWWSGFPLAPSWSTVVIVLVVSAGVGLLSGLYPAYRAACLQPVEALRSE